FKAGSNNALAKLNSIEGSLLLSNQAFTDTPGSGTLTNSGSAVLYGGSALSVSGNLTNSGQMYTYYGNNTLTVTGKFTNQAGSLLDLNANNSSGDVANIGTLANSGAVYINTGATLNLTNQPNGITDVVAGSSLNVLGTFKAGSNNALAKLNSIEGSLSIGNGLAFTDTPGSGTLTIASGGSLVLTSSTPMTLTGRVDDSGGLSVNGSASLAGSSGLTVDSGGSVQVGEGNTASVLNIGTLANSGTVSINTGATLNLTNQ